MKIVITIPNLDFGGAERVTTILSKYFAEEKHEVSIILLDSSKVYFDIDFRVNLIYLGENVPQYTKTSYYKRTRILRDMFKKLQPDVIISFLTSANMLSIIASLGLRSKVIVSERSDPNKVDGGLKIKIIRNFLYEICDGLIFQTHDAANCFSKSIIKKSEIIYNPVKQNLPCKNMDFYDKSIVTASRLIKSKNIEMLIDAFYEFNKKHRGYKLVIYGEGPNKAFLENYVASKHIDDLVIFKGSNSEWFIEAINSSAFVISSNFEGMSNSLIEAMAVGIPCISTDHPIGGARELINDGVNGVLIPCNSTHHLIKSLEQIILNKDISLNLSNEGTKIRHVLDEKVIVKKWLDFIDRVIGGR